MKGYLVSVHNRGTNTGEQVCIITNTRSEAHIIARKEYPYNFKNGFSIYVNKTPIKIHK